MKHTPQIKGKRPRSKQEYQARKDRPSKGKRRLAACSTTHAGDEATAQEEEVFASVTHR